ncbi:YccS family putative transporter [Neisseriaceae bacterium ESL0693]|nr:YccS family putative transporter [Neisseriaceae bacterium ESL0693]
MKAFSIRSDYLTNIPIVISMSVAALWVWYTHATAQSMPLFLGIIAGGLVEMDDRLMGRLRNLFFTLVHFSLAASLVQITYGHPWAFSVLMVAAAFSVTLMGAIDVRYRTIAFGTLLVMLYTVLTYVPHASWYINPMMLICGTVLYSCCTMMVHILAPNRPVQDNLVAAFSQLADYMRLKAQLFDPDEVDAIHQREMTLAMSNTAVIDVFNRCRSALFYRLRNQHRHRRTLWLLQYYLAVQNIHERISSRHIEYCDVILKLAHTDLIFRIQRLIMLQAQACQDLSRALQASQPYQPDEVLNRAAKGLIQALALYRQSHADDADIVYVQQLIDNLLAINRQLQQLPPIEKISTLTDELNASIAGQDVEHIRDILPAIRAHLTMQSGVMRHAVRLAIVTAVSCLIVEVCHLRMGYWILLTAVIVCQPNYSATTARLKQRVAGTLLGVLVGSVAPYFVDTLAGLLLIVVVGTVLFFVFRLRRYSFSTFFITVQVLAGFAIIGMDTQAAMLSRFMDTVIGCVLAWCAVSYLWPDWHYLTLGRIGRGVLETDGAYLQQVARQLAQGQRDDVTYRTARRNAYECGSALSTMVADMSGEPDKYGSRLTTARTLLLLNYILLSSISALGALRQPLNQQQHKQPCPPLSLCIDLMENMALQMQHAVDNPHFQAQWQKLQAELAQCRPEQNHDPAMLPVIWLQLKRIHDKLADYVIALQLQEQKTEHTRQTIA